MKPAPILLCLGTLSGGILLGLRHVPPAPVAAPPPAAAAPQAGTKAVPAPSRVKKLLTIAEADEFLNWLETAPPEKVLSVIAESHYNDRLRAALAKNRFLKFPPLVRLSAMLAPMQNGNGKLQLLGTEDLAMATAADAVSLDPAGCATLLAAAPMSFGSASATQVFRNVFEQDGWTGLHAFLDKLPPDLQSRALPRMIGLLATKDLAAAQKEVAKIAQDKERNYSAMAVAEQMMASDPGAAFEWLKNNSKNQADSYDSGAASYPIGTFLLTLFTQQPEAAKKLILENQNSFDGLFGVEALCNIFTSWGSGNFAEAREWLEANPLGDKYQTVALSNIYNARINALPAAEVSAFCQSLTPEQLSWCAGAMVQKLGLDELPGGLESFRAGLPPSAQSQLDEGLRLKFESADAADKSRILKLLGPERLISEYSGTDEQAEIAESAGAEALAKMSDSEKQAWTLKQTKIALNAEDLPKAMELLQKLGPNPRETLPHAQVAVGLLSENPTTATAWVEALPDGSAKSDAIFNLAANWGKTDLPAATAWVEALPAGAGRDQAMESIVKLHGLYGESATAVRLTQSIQNEKRRLAALAAATRIDWFNNPAATEQLINQQIPNPDQARKVLDMIQKGSPLR